MSIFRATDWDGQVLHGATVQELGEKTSRNGTPATMRDVHELDPDQQHGPMYVGYMAAGVLHEHEPDPDRLDRAGLESGQPWSREPRRTRSPTSSAPRARGKPGSHDCPDPRWHPAPHPRPVRAGLV